MSSRRKTGARGPKLEPLAASWRYHSRISLAPCHRPCPSHHPRLARTRPQRTDSLVPCPSRPT
ncbi:Uncharacterized protein ChrSV_4452 [Chromobacterium vaccinii]|nr:Uncharacterized protein ChrSW_4452 [Chromobacterium vaccinii]QND91908.1 Uncharacterized protein ChrSV_4452 [Chromobacterium vaccinii]